MLYIVTLFQVKLHEYPPNWIRFISNSAFRRIPRGNIFSKIPCIWIRPTSILCGSLLPSVGKIVQHKCGGCLATVYKRYPLPRQTYRVGLFWLHKRYVFMFSVLSFCGARCNHFILCICLSFWLFKIQWRVSNVSLKHIAKMHFFYVLFSWLRSVTKIYWCTSIQLLLERLIDHQFISSSIYSIRNDNYIIITHRTHYFHGFHVISSWINDAQK